MQLFLKFTLLHHSGFVENDRVKDFSKNREKFVKKGRGAVFNEALEQMDQFISDPVVIIID